MRKVQIYLEPSKKIVELEQRIEKLEKELAEQKKNYKTLEQSYIYEVECNLLLVDLLKANGIQFRPQLSRLERRKHGK